jgi:hypothetical protein
MGCHLFLRIDNRCAIWCFIIESCAVGEHTALFARTCHKVNTHSYGNNDNRMDIDPIADIADQSFAGYVCNTNTICCSVLQLTNKKAAITIIAEMSFYCKFQNFYSLIKFCNCFIIFPFANFSLCSDITFARYIVMTCHYIISDIFV